MNRWAKTTKKCRVLNYTKHLLILISAVSGCIVILFFAYLVSTPVGVTTSALGLKICAIPAGIKKFKTIIKKKEKIW